MPSRTASAQDAKTIIKIYAADLAEYPASAAIEMIRMFRRGKKGDGKWMPTPGEIAKAIDDDWRMIQIEKSFSAAPRRAPEKKFRIDRDSKQGRAWDEYAKAAGVSLIWAGGSYWYFETEWPPAEQKTSTP